MKTLTLAVALCASIATTAAAETGPRLSQDQLRNDMIVSTNARGSATTSSGAGLLIPLMLIVILAAAASSGTGGHPHYSPHSY